MMVEQHKHWNFFPTNNKQEWGAAEQFIRTVKNKTYKCENSI